MSAGFAQIAMLWGLAGVAIPVVIHLLNRRRAEVVDWGAMQFLELGHRAKRKFQITDLLLLIGRMLLLGLVALALARPFWSGKEVGAAASEATGSTTRRDVVLILDGSDGMDRKAGGTTPRTLALKWARDFVRKLGPGDSASVLIARDRALPLVAPPSFDRARVEAALKEAPPSRGSSDLPTSIAEAFRILETTKNPSRDVIVLTDGQRLAWKPGESARWALLRDLHARLPVKPRLWSVAFDAEGKVEGADGAVGPLQFSRSLVAPGLAIEVSSTITNNGPGPMTRSAEWLVDGAVEAGSSRSIGPIPIGGKAPVAFSIKIVNSGSHVVSIRLTPGDDPLAANDEASGVVEVASALPVLLVDGEPGREPLSGEADFLRAALAPSGDETPTVKATIVRTSALDADRLKNQRVLVLANVDRLDPGQSAAVADFLDRGGGVLVAPGDKTDLVYANDVLYQDGKGWFPALLGGVIGDPKRKDAAAHPSPRTFSGPVMAPFGASGDGPLGEADLFTYRLLTPATREPVAAVTARLDTGDPWIVERPARNGRVVLLAGPIDAEGGTLPVNPDFVPWVHELIVRLADPSSGPRSIRPGEPIVVEVEAPSGVTSLRVLTPSGATLSAPLDRASGRTLARFEETTEPGIYRIDRPGDVGPLFIASIGSSLESSPELLAPAEAATLSKGWPLVFESDPSMLPARLFSIGRKGPSELWRYLVLAALGGLCLEVWMTRKVARDRGMVATSD